MKKLLLATFLGVFLVVGNAFAEVIPTVRASSSKTRVGEVQAILNSCLDMNLKVDGLWGPKTLAAVKKFQNENDLVADGIIGARTANALNDCWDANQPDPSPALCSNGATVASNCLLMPGSTSVSLCPNGMTLASNCTLSPGNNTTVQLCPNGMTLASNCTLSPNNSTQTTNGPEGSLTNITKLGSYNNTKVSEGERDIKVYGVEVTARDGDQRIDGLNIAFKNTGTGSTRITKYASDVSIWLDGVEIGRKLASQYSDDSGDTYTYRFSSMNGLIRAGQKSQITVAVTGAGSMDSADANNEVWMVEAGAIVAGTNSNYLSAASANGRYRDFGGDLSASTIDFQKAGGVSSDQRFRVVTSSSNPASQTVQVSQTADTNDVLLLAMDVKAENAAMILQKLPVTLGAVDGTSDGFVPYTNGIVKSLKLYANGVKIADESVPQDGTDSATETIIFGNSSKLNYKIASNATVKFEVRADLNDTENTGVLGTDFDNGDKIAASFTPTNLTNTVVELDNVNQDTLMNRSGSATGENQTLRSTGLQVTMGAATTEATANNSGEVLSRTIRVPVTVKAFDETAYLSQIAYNGLTPAGTEALAFTFEDAVGSTKVIPNSATWTSSNATVEGSAYRVDAGSTKNFILTVVISGTTGNSQKQYRVQLNKINSYSNSSLTTGQALQDLTPVNAFETSYYTLNLN